MLKILWFKWLIEHSTSHQLSRCMTVLCSETRTNAKPQNVVRKAERQDSEEKNEMMMNTFLNPAPKTPGVRGGL